MKELLYDSLFQAAVISPVIGFILGAIFGSGGNGPSSSYREIREIVVEKYIIPPEPTQRPRRGNGNDDGWPMIIAAGGALVITIWAFTRYFEEITLGLLAFTAFIAAMTFGIQLAARLRGHPFDTWSLNALISAGASVYGGWIVWWTRNAMDPQLVVRAKSLGPWEFFKSLPNFMQHSLPLQIAGLFLVAILMLFTAMRAIHHLSLYSANPSEYGGFWWWLARKTKHTGGSGGLFVIALLGGMAWLCAIDGTDPNGLLAKLFVVHLAQQW